MQQMVLEAESDHSSEEYNSVSINAHHGPGMQHRVRRIIQVMNHNVHGENKYLKTLLGNPTPLLRDLCSNSLKNNQEAILGILTFAVSVTCKD